MDKGEKIFTCIITIILLVWAFILYKDFISPTPKAPIVTITTPSKKTIYVPRSRDRYERDLSRKHGKDLNLIFNYLDR